MKYFSKLYQLYISTDNLNPLECRMLMRKWRDIFWWVSSFNHQVQHSITVNVGIISVISPLNWMNHLFGQKNTFQYFISFFTIVLLLPSSLSFSLYFVYCECTSRKEGYCLGLYSLEKETVFCSKSSEFRLAVKLLKNITYRQNYSMNR